MYIIKNYLFSLVIVLILTGCGKQGSTPERKVILTGLQPLASVIKEIAGNEYQVYSLVSTKVCLEEYEININDMKKISGASVYVKLGDNFAFEQTLLQKFGDDMRNTKILDCTEGIKIVNNNPHIWLSIENLKILAKNVFNILTSHYIEDKELFQKNLDSFIFKLELYKIKLNKKFEEKGEKYILSNHPYWFYFAKDFNVEEISIENEGKEATSKNIKRLISFAKENNIKTLFIQINSRDNLINLIEGELKIKAIEIDPFPVNIYDYFEGILIAL